MASTLALVEARLARQAAAEKRWEAFPENVKLQFRELLSAVGRSGSLERIQEWWAQNEESLSALGITVDTQHKSGCTALHWASYFGHEEIVRYLVDVCGADVDLKFVVNGSTPLIIAARNDKPACVLALLELGADPNLQDDEDRTALDVARNEKHQECIDILEQCVAIPTVKSALKG